MILFTFYKETNLLNDYLISCGKVGFRGSHLEFCKKKNPNDDNLKVLTYQNQQ